MPGLVGFAGMSIDVDKGKAILERMRDSIVHEPSYVHESLFCSPSVYATGAHLKILQAATKPAHQSQTQVWLEGEFYNQSAFDPARSDCLGHDAELFLKLHQTCGDFSFLKQVDGTYSAVLYSERESKVHLITDRHGLKPLYWGIVDGRLVWASELKAFLAYPGFTPVIDRQGVAEYFEHTHLLENRTWFEGIELVPPASVLTYDLKDSTFVLQEYWSWDDIQPMSGPIDEAAVAEEMGRLLVNAVHRRVTGKERVGIPLSGGVDSRALLAAMPEGCDSLHLFTFGSLGCDDMKIARRVARISGAQHHLLELGSDNWLMPRLECVWRADGAFSLLDMHGLEFADEYTSYADMCLNGFSGDIFLAGGYLGRILGQSEPYRMRNRGRRCINQAVIVEESSVLHRRPYTDNDLTDFAFSIPEKLRRDSYIRSKAFLTTFPKYFKHIPWQRTGCPIGSSDLRKRLAHFQERVGNKLKRVSRRFGISLGEIRGRSFHDYPTWTRQEPARAFFEELLLSKQAIYPEYTDRRKVREQMADHMEGKANFASKLCLILTFELWLQQVFEKKHRSSAMLLTSSCTD